MSTTYTDLPYTSFPDSIQSFVTMLNMVVSDGAAVTGYQQAMEDGNTALAQTYYAQITSADNKIIDANKMNTLMQTCIALQRFYQNDIEPYITNKETTWQNRINQFNYIGEYSPNTQYYLNNFVTYNYQGVTLLYICIAQPSIGTSPINTTYWRKLTIRGLQGASGTGLSFRYAWSSSESYSVNDVVTYNDAVWGCTVNNSNQTPVEGSSYWKLIYESLQTLYPFQQETPSGTESGYLWFEIISTVG